MSEWMQGRVWSGSRALEIGLVDSLGGLQTAITAAKKLAKLGKPSCKESWMWHRVHWTMFWYSREHHEHGCCWEGMVCERAPVQSRIEIVEIVFFLQSIP